MNRREREQAARDAATVTRVSNVLAGYLASEGKGAMVSVSHVLDLMNPRGLWQFDPEARRNVEQAGQSLPDLENRDPMTGCKPALPQA